MPFKFFKTLEEARKDLEKEKLFDKRLKILFEFYSNFISFNIPKGIQKFKTLDEALKEKEKRRKSYAE